MKPIYLPRLTNARFAKAVQLGSLFCAVLTDCQSTTVTKYAHVMFVHKNNEREPFFSVASEINEIKLLSGSEVGGSHYLGVFSGDGHNNLGDSDEWADLEKFTNKALAIVAERFSISESPNELPIPTAQQ